MRVPLRWWKIEPPTQTNVDGGVNGPVQSGSFGGPVQTVHVVVPPPELPPEPPSLIKDQIKSMWLMLVEDQRERRLRQQEADKYRATVKTWLICLSVGMCASLLFWSVVMLQWTARFGWLW